MDEIKAGEAARASVGENASENERYEIECGYDEWAEALLGTIHVVGEDGRIALRVQGASFEARLMALESWSIVLAGLGAAGCAVLVYQIRVRPHTPAACNVSQRTDRNTKRADAKPNMGKRNKDQRDHQHAVKRKSMPTF